MILDPIHGLLNILRNIWQDQREFHTRIIPNFPNNTDSNTWVISHLEHFSAGHWLCGLEARCKPQEVVSQYIQFKDLFTISQIFIQWDQPGGNSEGMLLSLYLELAPYIVTNSCHNIICKINFTLDQTSNQRLLWSKAKLIMMKSFINKCLNKITGDMLPRLKSRRETKMHLRDSITHLILTAHQSLISTEEELHRQTTTSTLEDSQLIITIMQTTKTERFKNLKTI